MNNYSYESRKYETPIISALLGIGAGYEKSYLFGAPKDDDEARFAYIESSHFMKGSNTYATLLVERDGRAKKAKIAWVKLD